MRKNQQRRSNCPISVALETFGDTWSLLIIRDIVYFGKRTYGEFLESPEGIATNILACRLVQLEEKGILTKCPDAEDKRKEVYSLTDKGLDLIPVLLDMATWSARYDPEIAVPQNWITAVNANRDEMIRLIRETVQHGGSIFAGPDCLMSKLARTAPLSPQP